MVVDEKTSDEQRESQDEPRIQEPFEIITRGEQIQVPTVQISVNAVEKDTHDYHGEGHRPAAITYLDRVEKRAVEIMDVPEKHKERGNHMELAISVHKKEVERHEGAGLHDNPANTGTDHRPPPGSVVSAVWSGDEDKNHQYEGGKPQPANDE